MSKPHPAGDGSKGAKVEIVTYWQRYCAPYLRAMFARDERGASLVEYALLVALIALVAVAAVTFLGGAASNKFSKIGSAVNK
jgi:pilus assembly protein Flp/PilA